MISRNNLRFRNVYPRTSHLSERSSRGPIRHPTASRGWRNRNYTSERSTFTAAAATLVIYRRLARREPCSKFVTASRNSDLYKSSRRKLARGAESFKVYSPRREKEKTNWYTSFKFISPKSAVSFASLRIRESYHAKFYEKPRFLFTIVKRKSYDWIENKKVSKGENEWILYKCSPGLKLSKLPEENYLIVYPSRCRRNSILLTARHSSLLSRG